MSQKLKVSALALSLSCNAALIMNRRPLLGTLNGEPVHDLGMASSMISSVPGRLVGPRASPAWTTQTEFLRLYGPRVTGSVHRGSDDCDNQPQHLG